MDGIEAGVLIDFVTVFDEFRGTSEDFTMGCQDLVVAIGFLIWFWYVASFNMKSGEVCNYFVRALKVESKVTHYFVHTFVRDGFL